MPDKKFQPWLVIGYKIFSKEGPTGLKVERIAKEVGKSKSSFYHHFAEPDLFTESLLQFHHEKAMDIARQVQRCKSMVPDMLNLLLEVKEDIFFNRQLRIHRQNPAFKNCFEQSHEPIERALLKIWTDALGLDDKTSLARLFLNLTVENFYLQVTEETFTYSWLKIYLHNIQAMVREMKKSSLK